MEYNKLVPELSVTNIDEAKRFYIDILGFKLEYERPEDKFAYISYNGAQMMIEEINNHWNVAPLERPFGRGINFQIETTEIDNLQERLVAHNIALYKPIFESRYTADNVTYVERELLVQDMDGYLLRFQQTEDEIVK